MPTMKPALFNEEMVLSLLKYQKSATRRLILPQPKMHLAYHNSGPNRGKWGYPTVRCTEESGWDEKYRRTECLTNLDRQQLWTPPCHADDILYVRETWCLYQGRYLYRADYPGLKKYAVIDGGLVKVKWRPSIHMPKEAARIFLRVKRVGVERLQEITEKGAIAEGVFHSPLLESRGYEVSPLLDFRRIWNHTIKRTDRALYGWDANPFVWVIEFDRCKKPEESQDGTD